MTITLTKPDPMLTPDTLLTAGTSRLTIALREGEVVSTPSGRRGMHLECESGSVWVTSNGAAPDDILEAGRSVTIRPGARVVIQAMGASRVALATPLQGGRAA